MCRSFKWAIVLKKAFMPYWNPFFFQVGFINSFLLQNYVKCMLFGLEQNCRLVYFVISCVLVAILGQWLMLILIISSCFFILLFAWASTRINTCKSMCLVFSWICMYCVVTKRNKIIAAFLSFFFTCFSFSLFRIQSNMKCIVFVNRIVTARCLSHILQNLNLLTSWKCDYLVGVHSGWKSMSRKTMNNILEKFRTGKVM